MGPLIFWKVSELKSDFQQGPIIFSDYGPQELSTYILLTCCSSWDTNHWFEISFIYLLYYAIIFIKPIFNVREMRFRRVMRFWLDYLKIESLAPLLTRNFLFRALSQIQSLWANIDLKKHEIFVSPTQIMLKLLPMLRTVVRMHY